MLKRAARDDGVTLVTVVVIMLVLTVLSLTAASVVMSTTGSLAHSRPLAQSRAAADAGIVEMVADATRLGLTCGQTYNQKSADPSWTGSVTCEPSAKKATFNSIGYAGSTTTAVRAVYEYWAETSGGAADGALVSGSGGMNATTVSILDEGDLILNSGSLDCNNNSFFGGMVAVLNGKAAITNSCQVVGNLYVEHGDFECNSQGKIGGDVIVRSGNAYVTNDCRIGGRLFVESGDFKCDSNVAITGDVMVRNGGTTASNSCKFAGNLTSRGNVKLENSTRVEGNLTTLGNLQVLSAAVAGSAQAGGTVNVENGGSVAGSLTGAGTGTSYLYQAKLGQTWIGGSLRSNLEAQITGDLWVAGTGSVAITNTKATGSIKLGGGYSGTAPTVGGAFLTGQRDIGVPPAPLLPTSPITPDSPTFTWIDFPYDKTKWEAAGYAVITLASGECRFDSDTSGVAARVTALTAPTVIDARACGAINAWGRTFTLRTDVVLVVNQINAETVKVRSSDGADHHFSLVVPDNTSDGQPTCASGQGKMQLYAFNMDAKIHGIAYSPCTIDVNNSSTTRWNGQIYGGKVEYSIGGIKLYYEPVVLPGLEVAAGGGGGSTSLVLATKPIEQGDVG